MMILEIVTHALTQEEEPGDTNTKKKKVKLLLFVYDRITHLENLNVPTDNPLQTKNLGR